MIQPTKRQLEFLDWEMGVFFHFGIRTYYEGHKDWDMQTMDAGAFNPAELDCEQWIRAAKDGGAKYAILVTKHHDGFANWPSKYTDYSVANTPWKNGKGDVVQEFVDACRKFDMKVGLYYSPAEFGSNEKDGVEYDDYFINQIGEILTNYGKIDYLWFDGCGSEGHEYDQKRIIQAIRRMQPEILIFNMWDPNTRWVGNESGLAPLYNMNEVSRVDFSVLTDNQDELGAAKFLPAECDCKIRRNWFYQDADKDSLKSLDRLMGMYKYSVGRGANFLINLSPDRRGLIPDDEVQRMKELGQNIQKLYENKLGKLIDNTLQQDEGMLVNRVILREDMTQGQRVEAFSIWAVTDLEGKPIEVYRGATIGHKVICEFPPIATIKISVKIEKEKAPAKIAGSVYGVKYTM